MEIYCKLYGNSNSQYGLLTLSKSNIRIIGRKTRTEMKFPEE